MTVRDKAIGHVRVPRASLTFSHNLCTSDSASCLQLIKLSIHRSMLGIVVGSVGGAGARSVGTRPTSSMFVSMLDEGLSLKRGG